MRILFKAVFFVIATCFSVQSINAQKPRTKKNIITVKKFKAPKLLTSIGSFNDSSVLSVAQAETVIAMPLKIVDSKKNEYAVSSYQFLYKRKVVTEDEQTGKMSPASSISSERFNATPLPELWVNIIREELKPGEELFFFDVIAKDLQGRVMYASNLKIMVK